MVVLENKRQRFRHKARHLREGNSIIQVINLACHEPMYLSQINK